MDGSSSSTTAKKSKTGVKDWITKLFKPANALQVSILASSYFYLQPLNLPLGSNASSRTVLGSYLADSAHHTEPTTPVQFARLPSSGVPDLKGYRGETTCTLTPTPCSSTSRFSTFGTAGALSADRQVQESSPKSTAKDILSVTWIGMEMLLKKVEGCLGGTLAKAPVSAVNAIIDIKNVHC